ncbi:hypothetical protein BDW22DRAFT_368592 [Trametopsis cervina]|nr:hypothetical protein BDW22DRAFT_368592 [Trametopsis cervina]
MHVTPFVVVALAAAIAPASAAPASKKIAPAPSSGSSRFNLETIENGFNTATSVLNIADMVANGLQALKDHLSAREVADASGALNLESVNSHLDTATHGLDVFSQLTDVASKFKDLFTSSTKRGDVDPQELNRALTDLAVLAHRISRRLDTPPEDASGALNLQKIEGHLNTAGHGLDVFSQLADVAQKFKDLFTSSSSGSSSTTVPDSSLTTPDDTTPVDPTAPTDPSSSSQTNPTRRDVMDAYALGQSMARLLSQAQQQQRRQPLVRLPNGVDRVSPTRFAGVDVHKLKPQALRRSLADLD